MSGMFAVFDFDGTLTRFRPFEDDPHDYDRHFIGSLKKDKPNQPIVNIARLMIYQGWRVEIWTSRSDRYKGETHEWLKRTFGPLAMTDVVLRMRVQGDLRPSAEVKGEWLDDCGAPPDVIFEDMSELVDFWRSKGIVTCQVAENF